MLIDSHCHIDFEEFAEDRAQVIANAKRAEVTEIVVPAVSQSTWSRTTKVCQQHKLYLALGLHPLFIQQHEPHHLVELDDMCNEKSSRTRQLVAVGEIGLDFYRKHLDQEKQLAYFSKQLIIAKRHSLPVIIHCRKAHDQCLQLLKEYDLRGGIIHAFNGSIQQAEKYQERDFLLGFGGMLTYERSSKLRRLLAQLPLTSISLETDAPDMAVMQHRGERNSPEYLPFVARAVAELKNVSLAEVAQVTSQNVANCLGLALSDDR